MKESIQCPICKGRSRITKPKPSCTGCRNRGVIPYSHWLLAFNAQRLARIMLKGVRPE